MSQKKVIATSIIGNALEFYDFTLYGVFAVIIAQLFFPSTNELASILASWGAFAAGFIMRPFGAMIFGFLGDRYGRKRALTLSIIGMGLPTLLIGLLPTYDSIGIFAPMLLILCRLIQGTCTGGEYNGAAIFALEHSGQKSPGMVGGLITGSCVIGALTATFLGSQIAASSDPEFYWRLAFIFGGIISFVGFYVRRHVSESPEFEQVEHKSSSLMDEFKTILSSSKGPFTISLLVGCLNGALSYTLFGFLNSYLKRYIGVALENAMLYSLIGLGFFMVFSPLFGLMMDRLGNVRYFKMAPLLVIALVTTAFFVIQEATPVHIMMAQMMLGLATAAIAGPQHAFVQRLFPVANRYLGISFSFTLGMALCGGTAPMILTYLIEETGNLLVPALYIAALSAFLFAGIATLFCTRDATCTAQKA